jgi:hypothetical protein
MRVKRQKEGANLLALIVVVFPYRFARFHRQGSYHLPDELAGTLIEAELRMLGIIGPFVYGQDILHTPQKRGGELAYTPLAFQVGLQFVFFSTLRTVV